MFSLDSHLSKFYNKFPEGKHQPIIGITTNYSDGGAALSEKYYSQVVKAGGTPYLIPPVDDQDVIINTLEHLDGLILTGGGDFNPLWCGEEPSTKLHSINAKRDLPELLITRLAFNRQIPMLGICRGIQTLAIALDGEVEQDIYENGAKIKHSQEAERSEPTHSVKLATGSILHALYRSDSIAVNTFHHQAVRKARPRFRVTAVAPDNVIEAMESSEFKPIMGVQWHPECLGDEGLKIFKWLVAQAHNFYVAKNVQHRILTLDTHCDTPMFFPQGVEFSHRDSRILYDLHKMTDGRQDAVIMAAYLPQPKIGQRFSQTIDLEGITKFNPDLAEKYIKTKAVETSKGSVTERTIAPNDYADLIFDKLEGIVRDNSQYISIARTPTDLYEDKRKGRKSIMFGIENGLALNGDLRNVKHFAQRGVVYITLCHNGDNDICDSARGCNTHNGVSQFGEKVIKEMNRYGIMVDLSHGGEKSFYDALDISSQPIVCSHSNSKALCDVPRNLTDDQMRALAAKGGVAHITLFHGFLKKEGEATILDAVAHLEHAIDVMGIEHVGVGTDFDGDGTVRGMADASEMINFTLQLLRRKYSERDIARIWGGNWLRVMAQVQASRL